MIATSSLRNTEVVAALFSKAAETLRSSPYRQSSVEMLPARGRIVVTGDLHDNAGHLAKILQLADLESSPDHHVVLQELIHGELVSGLDYSYRILAKIAALVIRFPGQVHPLLANHELAQMTRKAVSKGANGRVKLFNEALQFVFSHEWQIVAEAIDQFFAAMPIALRSESGLLCSHSLPSAKVMRRFDLNLLDRDLQPWDRIGPGGSAYEMVWGRDYTDKSVSLLTLRWRVGLFCVGHNHAHDGAQLRHGNVVVLNSDHEAGKVLVLDLANLPAPREAVRDAVPLSAVAMAQ